MLHMINSLTKELSLTFLVNNTADTWTPLCIYTALRLQRPTNALLFKSTSHNELTKHPCSLFSKYGNLSPSKRKAAKCKTQSSFSPHSAGLLEQLEVLCFSQRHTEEGGESKLKSNFQFSIHFEFVYQS